MGQLFQPSCADCGHCVDMYEQAYGTCVVCHPEDKMKAKRWWAREIKRNIERAKNRPPQGVVSAMWPLKENPLVRRGLVEKEE